MTRRDIVATYQAVEWSSNRKVVVKRIQKDAVNAHFNSTLHRLEKLDSPYLVRYLKCHEDENEFTVCEPVLCNGVGRYGEL